jgi:hypothetical protein
MFNITRLWGNIHVISMNCACRLNVRKYTFVVRIVEIWNSLPESAIQAKTVKKFEIGLEAPRVQIRFYAKNKHKIKFRK